MVSIPIGDIDLSCGLHDGALLKQQFDEAPVVNDSIDLACGLLSGAPALSKLQSANASQHQPQNTQVDPMSDEEIDLSCGLLCGGNSISKLPSPLMLESDPMPDEEIDLSCGLLAGSNPISSLQICKTLQERPAPVEGAKNFEFKPYPFPGLLYVHLTGFSPFLTGFKSKSTGFSPFLAGFWT